MAYLRSKMITELKRNVGFSVLAKIIVISLNLGASLIVARSIGPEGFGQYTFLVTLTTFFALLTHCGLESKLVNLFSIRLRIENLLMAAIYIKFIGARRDIYFMYILRADLRKPNICYFLCNISVDT